MDKRYRIKKKSDFDRIFAKKNIIRDQSFSILYEKTNNNHFRFGLSIGRKYGKAHLRNLIKRQIRSIIYAVKDNLNIFDFIIIIKPDANKLDYQSIKKIIIKLLVKSKLLIGGNNEIISKI